MLKIEDKKKFKLSLIYSISLFEPFEIDKNNPIFKLKLSLKEVKYFLEKNVSHLLKFFYFNKTQIHSILYDEDEIIKIDKNIIKNDISNHFYLLLLIEDNPNMVNYEFSIDLIKHFYTELKNDNKNIYKNLIYSKLILELIYNYRQNENNYNEEKDEEELKEIIKNINNKINTLDLHINKDNIKKDKIDKLYIDIINNLIEDKKFNFEKCKKIMEEIDMEKIDITKYMYEEFSKTLNSNENFKISEIKDFKDINKINFYFIVLKYIIKRSIYIYQIPFLFQTRKNILKIRNAKLEDISAIINNNDKLKYVFNFISDSKYYNKIYPKYNKRNVK